MASTKITRTQTAGDRTKATFSGWLKKSGDASSVAICPYSQYTNGTNFTRIRFNSNNLNVNDRTSGVENWYFTTNAVYRDPASWYHLVISIDTTQATASDRVRCWINGVQVTSFSAVSYPTQDSNCNFNMSGATSQIGVDETGSSGYFDGYMSHIHWTDGYSYAASTFGETDATTGEWIAKTSPSVTYGTNGFFLKFEDSSNLDKDSSSNNHTFTTSGNLIQSEDTPDNNFCTMSPLDNSSVFQSNGTQNFTNGNTTVECTTTSGNGLTNGTMGMASGKWYWEMNLQAIGGAYPTIGIGVGSSYNYYVSNSGVGNQTYGYGYLSAGSTNSKGNNGSYAAFGDSFTSGDILSFALDMDNYKFYAAKNGVWQNSGDPTSGATGTGAMYTVNADQTYLPCNSGNSSVKFEYNFGNGYFGTSAISSPNSDSASLGKFKYSVPSGYYALCTKNLNTQG